MIFITIFVVLVSVISEVQATSVMPGYIQCRLCDRASDLSQCYNQVACNATIENCFIDELITEALSIVYNAGCRAKEVCLGAPGQNKRENNLVACSKCCNDTEDCNTGLCGIKGDVPIPFTPFRCRFCHRAKDLSECVFDTCNANTEDCYIDELVTEEMGIVYNGGCRSKLVCSHGNGKRKRSSDLVACSRCCNFKEDCNTHLCGIKEGPSHFCNFDDSCEWKQSKTDTMDWHELRGPTQSGDTGPDNDHTFGNQNGTYFYIEASSPSKQGDYADLVSPSLSTNMSRCLEFWYSMYGDGIGTLNVTLQSIGEDSTTIFSISGNQGEGWRKSTTTIPEIPYDYNIVITGSVGPTYHGDIAIDDIRISIGVCQGKGSNNGPQLIG